MHRYYGYAVKTASQWTLSCRVDDRAATRRSVCTQSFPCQIYAHALAFHVKYVRVRTTQVGNRTFNVRAPWQLAGKYPGNDRFFTVFS